MRVPVVVLIDDAERLDLDLAVVLLENLTFRGDGQVRVCQLKWTDPAHHTRMRDLPGVRAAIGPAG